MVNSQTADVPPPGCRPAHGGIRRRAEAIVVLLLAGCLAGQALFFLSRKSVTADEFTFLALGYRNLTGSPSFDEINPPLIMDLSALPLLTLRPQPFPPLPAGVAIEEEGVDFLYYNTVSPRRLLTAARLPVLALSLGLCLLIWRWSFREYGAWAGAVSVFLYAFNPLVVSLSGLATPDLGAAAMMTAALFLFHRFATRPGIVPLVLTGVVSGLALASKQTALILIPSLGLLAAADVAGARSGGAGLGRRLGFWAGAGLVWAVLAVLTLNAVYGFAGTGTPLGHLDFVRSPVFREHPLSSGMLNRFTELIPCPLPEPYPHSLASAVAFAGVGGRRAAYLLGEISQQGWWYYYPLALLIKTPVALLLVSGWALGEWVFRPASRRRDERILLVPAGLLLLSACTSRLQIGIRHVVWVYPLLAIFAGRLVSLFRRSRAARVFAAGLACWYVGAALFIAPHYLAYFNETVGGPRGGHRYLIDSNLDWGQDVEGLVRYLDRRGIARIPFAHWIAVPPGHADRFQPLGCVPTNGWLAAQVNTVQGLTEAWGRAPPGCYRWLREREPDDRVGYSILLYHVPPPARPRNPVIKRAAKTVSQGSRGAR